MSTEFDSMKEKAYIERTPEAQHALLLFRKYTSMVKEQQRYDAGTKPLYLFISLSLYLFISLSYHSYLNQ